MKEIYIVSEKERRKKAKVEAITAVGTLIFIGIFRLIVRM